MISNLKFFLVFFSQLIVFQLSAQSISSVKINAHDGVKLSARYFSPGVKGPGILLLSMCDPSTDKSEWDEVASKLQSQGFHVLLFDYRSFGESEGQRPEMMGTMEDAMKFWREHWMLDVESAYTFLLSQENVNSEVVGIGGASCGVFMGLELALKHPNVKTFVSLGGPIDATIKLKLRERIDLPILIISANEGLALEWSDDIFMSSQNVNTRITKYKYVTHGTKIFEYEATIQDQISKWFKSYLK